MISNETDQKIMDLTYDYDANIILVNKGVRRSEDGFVLCSACNRWLLGENDINNHSDPQNYNYCRKHATTEDIVRGIFLFTRNKHDVAHFNIDLPAEIEPAHSELFYHSLKEAIIKAYKFLLIYPMMN